MFDVLRLLTFSIYVNNNDMQEFVSIEKPRVLFFNKSKHIIKPTRA